MIASTLGPILRTRPRTETRTPITSTYNELLGRVRGEGLLERRRGFYIAIFAVLSAALLGAIAGFVLLGDSWFQLLIGAALNLIFTQFAFLFSKATRPPTGRCSPPAPPTPAPAGSSRPGSSA